MSINTEERAMNSITVFHADHGVSEKLIHWAISQVSSQGFFAKTLEIPDEFESLSNALYGPLCGDPPILEKDVYYKKRSDDRPYSRMIRAGLRDSRLITIIGVKGDETKGDETLVFTCYGGPLAPREPGDSTLDSDSEKESRIFWSQHALASDSE